MALRQVLPDGYWVPQVGRKECRCWAQWVQGEAPTKKEKNKTATIKGFWETRFCLALSPTWQILGRTVPWFSLSCSSWVWGKDRQLSPLLGRQEGRLQWLQTLKVCVRGGDKHRGIYTYTRRKMGYMLGNILLFFYFVFTLLPFSHSGHSCCCIKQASKDARSRVGGGGSERPPKEAAAHCTRAPSGSSPLTSP